MATQATIDGHPDLLELRAGYERAAETPQARLIDGLTLLSGLYIAMSPWVVGFNGYGAVAVTTLISGLALTLLAGGFSSAYSRTHTIAWVTPLLGAWVVVVPWVVLGGAPPTAMIVSNVVAGGIATLLGIGVTALETLRPRRRIR